MIDYINPTKEQIIEYLESKGLQTRDDNGEIRVNMCPFCPEQKEDWTHFYVSYDGRYFCQKCSARGNLITLAKHFNDYKIISKPKKQYDLTEPIKSAEELKPEEKKKLPEPSKEDLKTYRESAEEYHNNLLKALKKGKKGGIEQKILDYLTKERGLNINTLKHFKIGWTGTSISIPIIDNNKIVNIRYRKSPFDNNKDIPKMTNTRGGKMTLFNVDCLKNSSNNPLCITEGEFDTMSLFQEGWDKVVSITCGAQTFKKEWVDTLEKEKSIYLIYDNDTHGEEGVQVTTSRLGAGKCFRVHLPKNKKGIQIKDLNEFFVKEKKTIDDFIECYNKAEKIKVEYEHIKHIKEFKELTRESLEYSGKIRGLATGYPELDKIWSGMRKGNLIVISGDTSTGKCHAKGTKILMFDGTTKKVEDIKIDDKLMGVDSKSRKVLKLAGGKEEMYKIIPVNGGAEPFRVNENHILSLKKNCKQYSHYPKYLNITVKNYLKLAKKRKHIYKLWHPKKIKFKEKSLLIDPYFLGLWLGDGTSIYPCITTADKEIKNYLKKYTKKLRLQLTEKIQLNNKSNYYCLTREKKYKSVISYRQGKYIYPNKKTKIGGYGKVKSMKSYLKKLNLIGNKHIPFDYKVNSEKNRLELLAGLIDSDGSKDYVGYNFYNKNKQLCKDIVFIARSLGFFASTPTEKYTMCKGRRFKGYKIYISGDVERIPLKIKRKITQKRKSNRNWLTVGFKVEKTNKENYYGFTLNKDSLYLLDSFIVNHNTFLCLNIILNLVKQGATTMLFSLEETIEEIVERFLLLDQNFDFQRAKEKFQTKGQSEDEVKKHSIEELDLAYNQLEKRPIYLYSGYNIYPKLLGEVVEKAVRDFGCEIIFIDHLHYFATGDRRQRTAEIGDIVRYLKLLARKFQIPIVLVVHPRKLERDNTLPTMEDLKDSSGIKQDADIVSLLYRKRDKDTRELSEICILNTDKNRHGKIGKVRFIFGQEDNNLCKFEPYAETINNSEDNEFKEKDPKEIIQISN